ncbi:MAG TPA: YDG domain-containing protein, partial [Caulobacteraceae bacterium]|nr:YDG domain-containing protein [Caulobacteraceae bacterium]
TAAFSGPVGVITPLAITASLTGPVTKVYDGGLAATLAGGDYVLNGVVPADAPDLSVTAAAGTYGGKDVGTNLPVAFSGLSLTGPAASDYSLATAAFSGPVGVITPLAITASLTGPVTKTYDGTIVATLAADNYTLAGAISGDTVGLNDPTTGTYDTKGAGTGKAVSVTGLALTGADAGDYTVASSVSAAIGTINPLALSAGLTGAVTKTYDGTTVATLAAGEYTLAGAISGDAVGLNDPTAGTYDTKGAGTGKTVTATGLALTGADAGDYTVASSVSAAIGTINPLALTATVMADSRIYNGATADTGAAALTGAIAGDQVSVTAGAYSFTDPNAGTGKTVTVSGVALTGADAGDYTLSVPSTTTASITPRPVTIDANDVGKLQGQIDPPLTFTIASGSLVAGDQVQGALVRTPGEAAGDYDIGQGSLGLSANYALTFVDGLFTIAAPTPIAAPVAPANAEGSNASNGPSSFSSLSTTGLPGTGLSGTETGTATAPPGANGPQAPFGAGPGTGESGSPYPDNRYVSDNIRFTVGSNP